MPLFKPGMNKTKKKRVPIPLYFDTVIVGAGISAMYCAKRMLEHTKNASVVLLERTQRVGGRIDTNMFAGAEVVCGAGVGRMEDKLMVKLLRNLDLDMPTYTLEDQASPHMELVDVAPLVRLLRREYRKGKKERDNTNKESFKTFATPLLGGDAKYEQFVYSVGYRDFDDQDVEDALYNYGLGVQHTYYRMPWQQLLKKLKQSVGEHRIRYGQDVYKILLSTDCNYSVSTKQGLRILCKTVIVAADIDTIQRLVPPEAKSLYSRIVGQPFMRVYGHFNAESNAIMQQIVTKRTLLPAPFQKIIPYNVDKGVYMITYCDDDCALRLHSRVQNTEANRRFFCHALEKMLDIVSGTLTLTEIRAFFWPRGTHCYLPPTNALESGSIADYRHICQRPAPHFFVIGEAVGKYHGWCEGALHSVESVMKELL